jgi:hypothetical protein
MPVSQRRLSPLPELAVYTWAELPTGKREAVLALVRETRRQQRLSHIWHIALASTILVLAAVAVIALVVVPSIAWAP